jgi:ATP-dependent helicase/nuclease subunit B
LAEQGLVDPATRRVSLLDSLSKEWTRNPTAKTVIAAGSTGSQAATSRLLGVVAGLPGGCVVLPGLDLELDDKAWSYVGDTPGHPQHGMANLLASRKLERAQVGLWPQTKGDQQAARRRRMINEALTPAQTTSDWLDRLQTMAATYGLEKQDLMSDALHGLALVEAKTEDEEALVLALAIREALETPGQSAMLVTPDRALARRTRAALQNWQIEVDDSAGIPLPEDPTGVFLGLVLHWWRDPGDPQALLALLCHRLAALGQARKDTFTLVRALDIGFLRGVRQYVDLPELAQTIAESEHSQKQELAELVQTLAQISTQMVLPETASIASFAAAHALLAEQLAANEQYAGTQMLWSGPGGELAADLFRSLLEDSASAGAVDFETYLRTYQFFAQSVSVRPRAPKGGRVRILGPLEARQQSADLVLLGGLDEGSWPSGLTADPFLPRALVKKLGLPDPERRLGLSAHDFAELACKPRVLLTRCGRKDGSPSIASRWIWRLKTLSKAAAGEGQWQALLAPETDYLAIARQLVRVDNLHPAPEPKPRPPVALRPKSLSVTRINTLIRNPYSIYCQKVLGLFRLQEVGEMPGGRERGTAIHDALEHWHQNPQTGSLEDRANQLAGQICQALLQAGFASSALAGEGPAAQRLALAYLHWQDAREAQGIAPRIYEKKGQLGFLLTNGDRIKISAKTDRLDRSSAGWTVLDYKTGALPTPKEVHAGFNLQLPLTGAILQEGGFRKQQVLKGEPVSELLYVKLSSGKEPFTCKIIGPRKDESLEDLVTGSLQQVQQLFENYANLNTPYLCQPRAKFKDDYSEYDLLARRVEWSAILQEKDET